MKDIKAAVVGLGLGRYFVNACAASKVVGRLVICDTDQARCDQVRAEVPRIAAAYAGLEEMLRAEKPDVVCIVTPDHMHRPQAELCLASGANVLMTKPLSTTLEDGKAIVRAAERSGRKLMVAHERRFRTRVKALKALLASGELGDLIMVQANQISDKRAQFAKSPWYASPAAGRSAVVGTGIHEIDLLRFLVSRPLLGVSAVGNRIGTMTFPADKTTATVLRFEGGVIGQTAVSYECHWPKDGPPTTSSSWPRAAWCPAAGSRATAATAGRSSPSTRSRSRPAAPAACTRSSRPSSTARTSPCSRATPTRRWRRAWPPTCRRRPEGRSSPTRRTSPGEFL